MLQCGDHDHHCGGDDSVDDHHSGSHDVDENDGAGVESKIMKVKWWTWKIHSYSLSS